MSAIDPSKRTEETLQRRVNPWFPLLGTLIKQPKQGLRLLTDRHEPVSTTRSLELMNEVPEGSEIILLVPHLKGPDPCRQFAHEQRDDVPHVGVIREGAPKRSFLPALMFTILDHAQGFRIGQNRI
jgi:hypothetical protein